jgi:outer membrane protein OmpA-like peptidoglycan-associated protein
MPVNPPNEPGGRFAALFLLAVVCSLIVHAIFFDHSRDWRIQGFSAESYDRIVPRTFRMKRVDIDPATLEEPVKPIGEKKEPAQILLPPEEPSADVRGHVSGKNEMMRDPIPKGMKEEKPFAETVASVPAAQRLDEKSISQLMEGSSHAPTLPIDPLKELSEATQGEPADPAFSTLDALLDRKEKLTSSTAPILMPTDLLFGYDSTTLKPEAEKSMEKLGTLIRRNGNARFRIEGHTDAFGNDDYNNALSLRRAEQVKDWLVGKMGIDPARISTAGFGKTHLLVPGNGSIEQQQLNRRVEIVITDAATSNP